MSDNPTHHQFWLDRLEPEILHHIAAHLSNSPDTSSAISLADTSPIQCNAVLNALSHTLRLTTPNPAISSRLTRFARPTIQTLSFVNPKRIQSPGNFSSIPFPHNPLSLMQATSLHRVEIFDEIPMLQALRNSPTVKELLIILEGTAPPSLTASVIKSLNLRKLELQCYAMHDTCPLATLRNHHEYTHIFSRTVRSLDTVCHSPHHDEVLSSYIPNFPNLTEVTVNTRSRSRENNEVALYHYLAKMTSVRIRYAWNSFDLALSLGHRVTHLYITMQRPLTFTQLLQLQVCTAIQHLSIQAAEGTEDALSSLFYCLNNLIALELSFAKLPYSPKQHPTRTRPTPYVDEVAMLEAFSKSNTPKLQQLELVDSVISADGITKILASMADRLTHFTVSILFKHERPLQRLGLVLQALIAHCPNIKSFSCQEYPTTLRNNTLGDDVKFQSRWIQVLLKKLRMTFPLLNCDQLEKDIESLTTDPNAQPFITPVQSLDGDRIEPDDPSTDLDWSHPEGDIWD